MRNYECVPELYHHGIKGMKWGVRRFQNKDGSLTNAGKKRYSEDDTSNSNRKKSSRQTTLEAKYRSEGMSKREAELAAEKRAKAEKYVATAVAVTGLTVTACAAAYAYNKYAVDQTINKDAGFQRIMRFKPGEQLKEGPMYIAYDNRDKTKYKGLLGKTFQDRTQIFDVNGQKVMNFDINPHDDVKVASPKRAKDTFANLYKNNAEFREAVRKSNKEMLDGVVDSKQVNLYKKAISNSGSYNNRHLRTNGYDAFNVGLVNKSDSGKKAADMFYAELRKQGVNAVQDINDKKYSGYRSKNPIIMFGGKYDYSGKVMSNDEIAANFKKAQNDLIRAELVEAGTKSVAKLGLMAVTVRGLSSYSKRQTVKNYRNEHPNSKLTDEEIVELFG